MERTYRTCGKIRRDIDKVLHENAMLFQDPKLPKEVKQEQERKNLVSVLHLDPDFIMFLLEASDE